MDLMVGLGSVFRFERQVANADYDNPVQDEHLTQKCDLRSRYLFFLRRPKTMFCSCHSVPFARLTLQTATPRFCRSCLKIQLFKDSGYPNHLTKCCTLLPFRRFFQNALDLVYVVMFNDFLYLFGIECSFQDFTVVVFD